MKNILRDLLRPSVAPVQSGGGGGDEAAGGAAAAAPPPPEAEDISDEEVDFVMRLGGPTTRAELTRRDMPMAFAVMEALKETRAHVSRLFEKYDMNYNRNIEPHEVGDFGVTRDDSRQPSTAACTAIHDRGRQPATSSRSVVGVVRGGVCVMYVCIGSPSSPLGGGVCANEERGERERGGVCARARAPRDCADA